MRFLIKLMINVQLTSDKLAITLSAVCVAHCFLTPSLLIFSSGFLFSFLENELIHKLILLCTLPISILALALGYKNHKTINFLLLALALSFKVVVRKETIVDFSWECGSCAGCPGNI